MTDRADAVLDGLSGGLTLTYGPFRVVLSDQEYEAIVAVAKEHGYSSDTYKVVRIRPFWRRHCSRPYVVVNQYRPSIKGFTRPGPLRRRWQVCPDCGKTRGLFPKISE